MIKLPPFNKIFLSPNYYSKLFKNPYFDNQHNPELLEIPSAFQVKIIEEKYLPPNSGVFMNDKTVVAIYYDRHIFVVPDELKTSLTTPFTDFIKKK